MDLRMKKDIKEKLHLVYKETGDVLKALEVCVFWINTKCGLTYKGEMLEFLCEEYSQLLIKQQIWEKH